MIPAGPRRLIEQERASALVSLAIIVFIACALPALAADPPTNAAPGHFLLMDRFGNAIHVSTNEVNSNLHPPSAVGLPQQIPTVPKGAPLPDAVRQRIAESSPKGEGMQWFPATPPVLMPYPGSLDEFGNTAIQPGAIFDTDPFGRLAQSAKYKLSDAGLRYLFDQSVALVAMSGTASGASALQYYFADFSGKWALLESGGAASWLSTAFNVQLGLSPSSRAQSPQGNLASLTNPNDNFSGPNGIWLSELAWQQSLAEGKVVVLAGMVDQSSYLDANNYANNSHGQFLNSAFVNSMVLPLPPNNLGVNIQWQPNDSWYLVFGSGANNQLPGNSAFANLSFDNWSYLLELGFICKDVFGLGPGNYRIQPFAATVGGQTQVGLGLNFGQQLGKSSPVAWFGRFGVGGSQVTLDGASAQVATGLAVQNPLKFAGLVRKPRNDYFGTGFIWSQPSQVLQPAVHANEYGLETVYVIQLTPFAAIEPDLQVLWNPVNNPVADHNFIFQLQLNINW